MAAASLCGCELGEGAGHREGLGANFGGHGRGDLGRECVCGGRVRHTEAGGWSIGFREVWGDWE